MLTSRNLKQTRGMTTYQGRLVPVGSHDTPQICSAAFCHTVSSNSTLKMCTHGATMQLSKMIISSTGIRRFGVFGSARGDWYPKCTANKNYPLSTRLVFEDGAVAHIAQMGILSGSKSKILVRKCTSVRASMKKIERAVSNVREFPPSYFYWTYLWNTLPIVFPFLTVRSMMIFHRKFKQSTLYSIRQQQSDKLSKVLIISTPWPSTPLPLRGYHRLCDVKLTRGQRTCVFKSLQKSKQQQFLLLLLLTIIIACGRTMAFLVSSSDFLHKRHISQKTHTNQLMYSVPGTQQYLIFAELVLDGRNLWR